MNNIKIIETPRDGIQGLKEFIPTQKKIELISVLLQAGFDCVEIGSFVSKKSIPQLADTEKVIQGLDLIDTESRCMILVANAKGGKKAAKIKEINYLLYPFSASPTFLKKNINSDFNRAFKTIAELQEICERSQKHLIVYLSMAFGNPYGDEWSINHIVELTHKLYDFGLRIIPLSDITGESNPGQIKKVYNSLITEFPDVEFGLHLHTSKAAYFKKVEAAYEAGCRRFDTVTGGLGGCPMTGKELLTNLNTFDFISFCEENGLKHGLNKENLLKAQEIISSFNPPEADEG